MKRPHRLVRRMMSSGVRLVGEVVRVVPPGRGVPRGVATLPVVLMVGRNPGQYHMLGGRRGGSFGGCVNR